MQQHSRFRAGVRILHPQPNNPSQRYRVWGATCANRREATRATTKEVLGRLLQAQHFLPCRRTGQALPVPISGWLVTAFQAPICTKVLLSVSTPPRKPASLLGGGRGMKVSTAPPAPRCRRRAEALLTR